MTSVQAGLLKNVQTHFSSPLESRDIAKKEVNTFFLKHNVFVKGTFVQAIYVPETFVMKMNIQDTTI